MFCVILVKKVQKCCALCGILTCILLLMLSLVAIAFRATNENINVVLIDTGKPYVFKTSERFLGVTLDSSLIAHDFAGFNMSDPKLSTLLSALAPGVLRVGGTMADRLHFFPNNELIFKAFASKDSEDKLCRNKDEDCSLNQYPNFTMSGKEWTELNKFAADNYFKLLFDLNVLMRYPNGSWNPSNAITLINYTSNVIKRKIFWQLGNEPDLFRSKFNYDVTPTQLAKDFKLLDNILKTYYKFDTLIAGPDVTRPKPNKKSQRYLKKFLESGGKNYVDVVSWHHYYFSGLSANASSFLDPDVFDGFKNKIREVKRIVTESGKNKTIWLTETSSAYKSGVPGMSDRYLASFIWMDKLGLAALNGIDAVMRQSFFKNNYALIDSNYHPSPDWWLSVLYKKLVGRIVVPCHKMKLKHVRLYCHCSKNNYKNKPHVTVFGMNMLEYFTKLRIEVTSGSKIIIPKSVNSYILSADQTMYSKKVRLNNHVLELDKNGKVPSLKPVNVSAGEINLPPYSLGFWTFPAPIDYCKL